MKDSLIPLHDILREIEFLNSLSDRTTFEASEAVQPMFAPHPIP